MTRPRGTLLDVLRSPFICGAGPDSERCGRQRATTLSNALSCHPEADLNTFTAVWIGESEQAHCRFSWRGTTMQRSAYPKVSSQQTEAAKNLDAEFPHFACGRDARRTDGWTAGWTDTLTISNQCERQHHECQFS